MTPRTAARVRLAVDAGQTGTKIRVESDGSAAIDRLYPGVRTHEPLLPQLARGRAHPLGTAANGYFSGSGRDIRLFLDTPLALDGELFTPATATEPTVLTSAGRVHFLRVES